MKTIKLSLPVLSLFGLLLSTSIQAQTSYPTPVDSNSNAKIDSAEIQAVIDATASGIIYLPASKTYNIDAPVIINKDNITLLGGGHGISSAGGTVLKMFGNIEQVVITNCTGSGLRSFGFSASATHTGNTVRLINCTNAFVEDVRIANAYNGIELVNCVSPSLTDVTMKGHLGAYGVKIWGSGGNSSNVQITRITGGGATDNTNTEWMIVGPNVNGVAIQSSRFVACLRGMRLTGTPGPTFVSTTRWGTDNQLAESVLAESGSGLAMTNSWIGQPGGAGLILGSGFTGNAFFTNLRIRGSGLDGAQINGGTNINIWNPLIGANGTDATFGTGCSGIKITTGVANVRINGGRVGPLYSQGASAKQQYGVRFLGTTNQSDSLDVKINGVGTAGNTVPFEPANLPL